MIRVLDPTAGPAHRASGMAPRTGSLDGATIGVIWNGRAWGDRILSEVLDILKQRHRIREVVFRQKPFLGNIAPAELLSDMAARANLVITGVGD
jgi:hypothetical protein